MAKLFCRVMKMKGLMNSISVQKLHTQSISSTPNPISLLYRRTVIKDCGLPALNLISILKNPILDTTDSSDVVVETIDLPYFKDFPSFEIRGRTHGMVCLADRNQNIMVGNPATSEFRTLPPSIIDDIRDIPQYCVRLGYDPNSKDFKVVRVFTFLLNNFKTDLQAEVYNLTTGRWTEITIPKKIPATAFEIYHKGIYYWWSGDSEDIILTFDFTHEVFRMVPVPESCVRVLPLSEDNYYEELYGDTPICEYGLDDVLSLTVWKGSIVLFHNPHGRGDEKYYDIWALDDVWVSWSKVLTIGPLSGVVGPLLFVNSDELLMEAMDGNVISYNVITKELKNLPMKGIPMKGNRLSGCMLSI